MGIWSYEIEATFDCDCGYQNEGAIEYANKVPAGIGCRHCDEWCDLENLSRARIHRFEDRLTRYFVQGEEVDEYGEPI